MEKLGPIHNLQIRMWNANLLLTSLCHFRKLSLWNSQCEQTSTRKIGLQLQNNFSILETILNLRQTCLTKKFLRKDNPFGKPLFWSQLSDGRLLSTNSIHSDRTWTNFSQSKGEWLTFLDSSPWPGWSRTGSPVQVRRHQVVLVSGRGRGLVGR